MTQACFRRYCLLILFFFQTFLVSLTHANIPSVLVTVAPHQFFVEKIAKETVIVHLMVPAGASAHTYEPTARQMISAGKGEIWFRTGEPFENRAIQALKSHHPNLEIVDMRQGLDLIYYEQGGKTCCRCCPGSADLHFWLSPHQAQIQAQTIANALTNAYPQHKDFYKKNLLDFQNELKDLDKKIQQILSPLQNRNILVSHPAYAYFCRDYNLEQYSVEMEGKDPSPQQMTRLLQLAKQLNFHTIFIQMQYSNKAAKLVADTIGAQLVVLDPYSKDYIESMLAIAHAFAKQ